MPGLLSAFYFVGSALGAIVWGWTADRIGRRNVLVGTTLVNAAFYLAFSMSSNLTVGIVFRCCGGFFDAAFPLAKSMLNDLVQNLPDAEQRLAFSASSLSWGVGTLAGPLIGGALARPAILYPKTFSGLSFFVDFPYALQGLILALWAASSCVLGLLFLPETLRRNKSLTKHTKMTEDAENDDVSLLSQENEVQENEVQENEADLESAASLAPTTPVPCSGSELESLGNVRNDEQETSSDDHDVPEVFNASGQERSRGDIDKWLVGRLLLLYGWLCLVISMRDEALPLWQIADIAHGGLGFDSDDVGYFLSVAGVFILVAQVAYMYSAKRLGELKVFRIGTVAVAALTAALPQTSRLAHSPAALWPVMLLIGALTFFAQAHVFTSLSILLNLSCGQRMAGRVNGIAGALTSVARAIGPISVAPLFALTTEQRFSWPINTNFVFNIASVLLVAQLAMTFGFGFSRTIEQAKR